MELTEQKTPDELDTALRVAANAERFLRGRSGSSPLHRRLSSRTKLKEEAEIASHGAWWIYQVWTQARLTYLFGLVLVCWTVFAFAFMTELFLHVYLPTVRDGAHAAAYAPVLIMLIPVFILALGWVFDELVDLVKDAANPRGKGSFELRVSLVTILRCHRHHEQTDFVIDYAVLTIVDVLLPLAIEVAMVSGFLHGFFTYWSVVWALRQAVAYCFLLCCVYAGLWVVLHFVCVRFTSLRTFIDHVRVQLDAADHHDRTGDTMRQTEDCLTLDYMGLRIVRPLLDLDCPGLPLDCPARFRKTASNSTPMKLSGDDGDADAADPPPVNWRRVGTALVVMAGALALMAFYFLAGWLLLMPSLLVLGGCIRRRFSKILGPAFSGFLTAFAVISSLLFLVNASTGQLIEGGVAVSQGGNSTSGAAVTNAWMSYPVCGMRFSGLSAVELTLLTDVAYGSTADVQTALLADYFGSAAALVSTTADSDNSVAWSEVAFADLGVTVVAVRGTADTADVAEDLQYYVGIALLQVVDSWISILQQLPEWFVVDLMYVLALDDAHGRAAYDQLTGDVADVVAASPENDVILVGHSLGGAMAAVAGARLQLPVLSVSGPGIVYNRERFGIDSASDIDTSVVTIAPAYDWVWQVDALGGLVQGINCAAADPVTCHSLSTTLCELYRSCGDEGGHRDWTGMAC